MYVCVCSFFWSFEFYISVFHLKSEPMVDILFDFPILCSIPSTLYFYVSIVVVFLVSNSFIHNKSRQRIFAEILWSMLLHISNTCCILCHRKKNFFRVGYLTFLMKNFANYIRSRQNRFTLEVWQKREEIKQKLSNTCISTTHTQIIYQNVNI